MPTSDNHAMASLIVGCFWLSANFGKVCAGFASVMCLRGCCFACEETKGERVMALAPQYRAERINRVLSRLCTAEKLSIEARDYQRAQSYHTSLELISQEVRTMNAHMNSEEQMVQRKQFLCAEEAKRKHDQSKGRLVQMVKRVESEINVPEESQPPQVVAGIPVGKPLE